MTTTYPLNNNESYNLQVYSNKALHKHFSPKIAIFDYGAGNLFSMKAALDRNGAVNVSIIRDMKSLENFDGLILP
ncbi:MAG: hypothetical protein WB815_11655, partial [Nitrososphaeraceae archaeon]